MFVVTVRDLQVKMREIRKRVNEGEEAILHSKGSDDLVLITLERYNAMDKMIKESGGKEKCQKQQV